MAGKGDWLLSWDVMLTAITLLEYLDLATLIQGKEPTSLLYET
jgi:hypothetical protein